MSHTLHDKRKILSRVRRLKGQVEGLERLLEAEGECGAVLQQIAACRGAVNSLMAHVMEGHVREHLFEGAKHVTSEQLRAADELAAVLRSYLK